MSRRRSVLLVLLGPLGCGLLAAALVTAGWLAIGRPQLAGGSTWLRFEKVGSQASFSGSVNDPLFFLVVGSDAREGGPGGSRGDAVHVVGVNPALNTATIIDIPRDTAVPIPGRGTDKINAALQYGGVDLMAQTVGDLVGISLPYAVVTDFDGFAQMVDEMGGIDIEIPQALDDPDSGASLPAGVHHLNGGQALAYARDRNDFPTGDIARTENQGRLIIAALATLRGNADVANRNGRAAETLRLLGLLGRHTELKGLGFVEMYRFGRVAFNIDPAGIRNVVVPTGAGGGSNLSVGAAAQSLFDDFRDDAVLQSH